MKNSIFDVVDNKVIIKPEALLISPFKEIWENKDKTLANNQIKYIWFLVIIVVFIINIQKKIDLGWYWMMS